MSIKNQGPWGKLRTSIKLHADSLLALNNVRWSTLTIWRRAAVTTTDWILINRIYNYSVHRETTNRSRRLHPPSHFLR